MEPDFVSALVCTRDRPSDLCRVVVSLLASEGVALEVIVIDQSDGFESAEALRRVAVDQRLRYVRSKSRGLGAALDEGLRLAQSPYVVHTDDDCLVGPTWAAGMALLLRRHPKVALVFCNVDAAPHDATAGYVPAYSLRKERVLGSVFATCRGRGLGAGMAYRREAVLGIGGVDVMMGAGGRFPSCEDWDTELRVLLRGWEVLHTPDLSVLHFGFRTFAEGRRHAARDWMGIGAGLAKLLRAGHPSALALAAWELGVHAVLPPVLDLAHLRRPRGLQRIVSFCGGFTSGLLTPVDRRTMCFIPGDSLGSTS